MKPYTEDARMKPYTEDGEMLYQSIVECIIERQIELL